VILYVMFIRDILMCDGYHSEVTGLHLMLIKKSLTAMMSWSSSEQVTHVRELNKELFSVF